MDSYHSIRETLFMFDMINTCTEKTENLLDRMSDKICNLQNGNLALFKWVEFFFRLFKLIKKYWKHPFTNLER